MSDQSNSSSGDWNGEPIPRAQWEAHVERVTAGMRGHTLKFVTPVSQEIEHDYGELLGTGNYVQLRGQKYLLTNEHVAAASNQSPLGHQYLSNHVIFRVLNPFRVVGLPLDVAVGAIDERIWTHGTHDSAMIPESKFAIAHTPVDREILFFIGFSGQESKFSFGHLITNATSYGCQEIPLPINDTRFNSRFHFALDYRPDRAKSIGTDRRGLPVPKGFSGSLVWNTRFVEHWGKQPSWTPDCAQVTGLVWGWPSSLACIVATRIEYVRSSLLRLTELD